MTYSTIFNYFKAGSLPKPLQKGWVVVIAGIFINLTFGCLYTWSIFSTNLSNIHGWTSSQSSMPYSTGLVMFASIMLIGGKLQDLFGPRLVTTLGGIFIGLGLYVCSAVPTLFGVILGFGVLTGAGVGLGYSAVAPTVVKWFPPNKKGIVVGVVLTGFGLAPLYIAPLTKYLIASYDIFTAFKVLGLGFGITIIICAQFMAIPPDFEEKQAEPAVKLKYTLAFREYDWKGMIRTPQFALLWIMYFSGAMTGLMLMGHMAKIAQIQTGSSENIVILIAAFSISNAFGRPISGWVSDKIGRGKTMAILYITQGITLLFLSKIHFFGGILIAAMIVTFSYGAMLTVFPAAIADFYGTKNMGFNYAILFTSWGFAGFFGPQLAGFLLDLTGGYNTTFMICAVVNLLTASIGLIVRQPRSKPKRKERKTA